MMKNILLIALTLICESTYCQIFKSEKFSINCGCTMQLEPEHSSANSKTYKCLNYNDKSTYRITVANHEKEAAKMSSDDFYGIFTNGFLKQYSDNLKKTNFKSQEILFNKRKALKYQSVQVVQGQNVYIKAIIFLENKRAYTMTVTGFQPILDSVFNTLKPLL